jgi:magnesium chelatase subunit D
MTATAALSAPTADSRSARWDDAVIAAQLLALDPAGLGGATLAAGFGSARDLWLDGLCSLLAANAPVRRVPAGIEDDRLLGGIDLVATLKAGRPVLQKGLLAEADGGILVIPMAERLSAGVAARLCAALDRREVAIERDGIASMVGARVGIVAFDEGRSDEERIPPALLDRLAFHIDLNALGSRGLSCATLDGASLATARDRLATVGCAPDEIIEALVATAARFGIASVVAPLLALRAARAAAALAGHRHITTEDAVLAARLVLGPRALTTAVAEEEPTSQNAPEPEAAPETAPSNDPDDASSEAMPEMPSLEEVMLAAVRAALPDGLLASMHADPAAGRQAGRRDGSGSAQASPRRGRPAGVRPGAIRPGARLALVDTLRAAAPWQPVRRVEAKGAAKPGRIDVRREDFRLRKFVRRRETTIVFCVDASGSTAFHRLAETKGAVELLLGKAYAARTHVALVVFRGTSADLLLPPTRSLSRAKALLATLPGGGGTPLAAGIDTAIVTAMTERARGREPMIVLLSDGRANIGRDGLPARPQAGVEALTAATQIARQRVGAVFIDTSPRPRPDAADLAAAMAARYVALPYVEAAAVCDAVMAARPGPQTPHAR